MFRTYQNALWQTQTLPKGTDRKASITNRGSPPTKLTEQQVLECRARHEFGNWHMVKLANHYGTSFKYMQSLLEYIVRSRLIPKPEHANLESLCFQ